MQRAYRDDMHNAHTAAPTGCPQPDYRATSRTTASVSVSDALPPKGYYSESIKRQARRHRRDTRELEWRLDELVYALYGLTEAESTAIERSLGLIHATDAAEEAALLKWVQEALAEPDERVSMEDILKILRNP